MNKKMPLVSIVLVNYNQPEVTEACLLSLEKISYKEVEVFVVDNGSKVDNLIDESKFPGVHFIRSEKNLGFAGGNNLALRIAKGDYLMLLNNDTEVPADFLQPLVETFNRFPDAGIVSPKIKFFYSDNLIQYAGTSEINPFTCSGSTFGYKEFDDGRYDTENKTDLAHGACMIFSRKLMDEIGYLPEEYFIYYEEYDYCMMARRAGYSIYYNGLSWIRHKQSVSVGVFSPLKAYYMAKNRILFVKRNFKPFQKVISLSYYYLLALPKSIVNETFAGRHRNSLAILKGATGN
jgi:hypothetical protein